MNALNRYRVGRPGPVLLCATGHMRPPPMPLAGTMGWTVDCGLLDAHANLVPAGSRPLRSSDDFLPGLPQCCR